MIKKLPDFHVNCIIRQVWSIQQLAYYLAYFLDTSAIYSPISTQDWQVPGAVVQNGRLLPIFSPLTRFYFFEGQVAPGQRRELFSTAVRAAQLLKLGTLGVPVLILIAAYTISCFVIGGLLTRAGCFDRAEGMLAATPAGASDMALISADLGVSNAKLIVLQVLRLITVVLVFPTILSFVAALIP